MIFIHTLRMLTDLSVYFFIAELAVNTMGGSSQFVQFLLLGLSYGILVFLQNRNFNRLYMVLPVVVLFIPGSSKMALLLPIVCIMMPLQLFSSIAP